MKAVRLRLLLASTLVLTNCSLRSSPIIVNLDRARSHMSESDKILSIAPEVEEELKELFRKYVEEQDVEFFFCAWGEVSNDTVFITQIDLPPQKKLPQEVRQIEWSRCNPAIAWGHAHPIPPKNPDPEFNRIVRENTENLSTIDEENLLLMRWKHTILIFARDTEGQDREIIFKLFSK
jgi:hypothetical protein